jgi:hypothetical protein
MRKPPTRPVRQGDEGAALAPTVAPRRPRRVPEHDAQQPPAEPRRRRRGALVKVTLALLAALVAVAAAFGGRGMPPSASTAPSSDAPAAAIGPTARVSGRELALRVPRGWSRARRAPHLGLPLSGAIGVGPRGSSSGPAIEFGVMKGDTAANSALLPAAFLSSIAQPVGTVPPRAKVSLPAQRLQAWRYANLRPAPADREVTVYTVPTTRGVATVACAAPARAAAFTDECAAVAGSLELLRGRPYPVGASDAYASVLDTSIRDLVQATTSDETDLQAARTLAGQAAAERALADAYETAAEQLAALELSPADRNVNRRLVASLRRAGKAYRRASRTATAGAPGPYRAASAAIPAAKAGVASALGGVSAAGYQVARRTTDERPDAGPAPSPAAPPAATRPADPESDVGDSRSDDPSDDSAEP